MKIMPMFDVLHTKVVRNVVFQKLTDFTRGVTDTNFAHWDTIFSPLCLLIAVVASSISYYKAK